MKSRTPGFPVTWSGFMMNNFTARPSWVTVFSIVLMPDMSTGVCDWSPVRISWGLGCGSSQKGLLSLLISARNERICGSIRGSVAAFWAAEAMWVTRLAPIVKAASLVVRFMGLVRLFVARDGA